MKRLVFIFSVILLVIAQKPAKASHLLGGEISWECITQGTNTGKVIFTIKLYRACVGINLGTSATINNPLYATYGGTASIVCTRTEQNDLSPDCYDSTLQMSCYTGSQRANVMEENVYVSAAVQINGTPATTGSAFWFTSCCRPATTYMKNITGSGYYLRAVMFPYTDPGTQVTLSMGSTTGGATCYDSSPYFAEKPATIICTGYPFTYNHNAADTELDSLHYEWTLPMQSASNGVLWKTGYSTTSQLPGTTHHPSNVPATIDPLTGEIKFTAYAPQGNYHSTAVKVTSYKCRQKVAEIYRDIPVILLACPPTPTIPPITNTPPQVTFKWAPNDPTSIPLPAGDTVWAGDKVEFYVTSTDIQFLPGFVGQTNYLLPNGSQFGNLYADTINGCKYPPCATLDTTSTFYNSNENWWEGQFGIATRFNWTTDCNHLAQVNACFIRSNTYNFVFKVLDDWCPAPGMNFQTFAVTVLAPPALEPPQMKCAQVNTNGSVTLKWTQPVTKVEDTLSSFRRYLIMRSDSAGYGPGVVYDSLHSVYDMDSLEYTDLTANIGQGAKYYFVRGISSCNDQGDSILGDTISGMHITAQVYNLGNGVALDWNDYNPGNRWGSKTTGEYYVHQVIGTDTTVVDTTTESWDSLSINLCYPSYVQYFVTVVDTSSPWGCVSNSDLTDVDTVGDNIAPATILLDSVSYDTNNDIQLGWSDQDPDIGAFIIFKDIGAGLVFVDSVVGTINTYSYTRNGADPWEIDFSISAIDTCGNFNAPGPEQISMRLDIVDMILCDTNKKVIMEWNNYSPTWLSGSQWVRIYRSDNNGPWTLIDSVSPVVTSFEDTSIQQNTHYKYRIRSWENGMQRGAWSAWDSITVPTFISGYILNNPSLRCVSWVDDTTLRLTWQRPFNPDTNFNQYRIWHADTSGVFKVVDSIRGATTSNNQAWYTTTYDHIGAYGDEHTYYLQSMSGCDGQQIGSNTSNKVSALNVVVTTIDDSTNNISWNRTATPQVGPGYVVLRDQTFNIGNPAYGTESVNDKLVVCDQNVIYTVEHEDPGYCTSYSKEVDGNFKDVTPPAKQFLDSVSMRPDTTYTGMVGWTKNPSKDVTRYYVMYCTPGSYQILDTVQATSPLYFEDFLNAPLKDITQYSVMAIDSCDNHTLAQLNFDCHSTMKLDVIMDFCDQSIRLNWNPYTDFASGTDVEYVIYASSNGGSYAEIGRTTDPKFKYKDIVNGNSYCFYVQGWDRQGQGPFSSSTSVECVDALFIDNPEYAYMKYATVHDSDQVRLCMKVDLESNIGEYWVKRSTRRDQGYKIIATIPIPDPLTPSDSVFCYEDLTVRTDRNSYYYKIDVVDPCGTVGITSNHGRTMVLNVDADNETHRNILKWNQYEEWNGGVNEYEVYRGTSDKTMKLVRSLIVRDFSTNPDVTQKGEEITFVDDVSAQANSGNGQFCYYILAKEGSDVFPGTKPATSKSNVVCTIQYPLFYVPTAFTPNGDGKNDRFLPLGAFHDIKSYNLQIFNRWGEMIFESDDYKSADAGWDGTYNGKPSPNGAYVYIVKYSAADGQEYEKKGTVTLSR